LAITDCVACFFGVKTQPFIDLHIVSILNSKAEKTPQHFNASLFVNIWVAVIGSFFGN
jgi:hypothetical protein